MQRRSRPIRTAPAFFSVYSAPSALKSPHNQPQITPMNPQIALDNTYQCDKLPLVEDCV